MKAEKFISIGSKGTSIPTDLTSLEQPLRIGINQIRWAGMGKNSPGHKAHAWVSERDEKFELYPLADAVRDKKVVVIERAQWKANGTVFKGSAFFPADWKPGNPQPSYVAVESREWPHGSVERNLINDGRNRGKVGKFLFDNPPKSPPAKKRKSEPKLWTHEDRLVALNVYRKLPFGQLDEDNPVIIQLARKMGRTPGSLAMKLCNFASLDPLITSSGRKGLPGASDLDRALWQDFLREPDIIVSASEEAFRNLFSASETDEVEVIKDKEVKVVREKTRLAPTGETNVRTEVTVRRGQDYFRQVILNAFENRCCVSGIHIRSMLVASHILPWSTHPRERLNPLNGLCLSRIHDAAFDRGLITFDEEYRLVLSKSLKDACTNSVLKESFAAFEGKRIDLPKESPPPNPEFLAQHRITFSE